MEKKTQSVTRHRDLRTGQPVWLARRRPHVETKQLVRDLHCDVLVIGAGISGAMIAEAISAEGLSVVVVDRRGVLQGSTPASTALLQYEIDTPLRTLSAQIGRTNAERIWHRSRLAVDALRERSRWLGIEAGQANRDTLYLSGNLLCADQLALEGEARKHAGFQTAYLKPGDVRERYGIRRRSALLSFDNLAADPVRLAAGFLNCAIERGARFFAPVDIVDIEASAAGVSAKSETGPTIHAGKLIFATGYEFPKGVPMKGHRITSTWAIATRPQKRNIWPGACFIWEAAEPYLYIRTTEDGRVICGGEDAEFSDAEQRDAQLPAKTRILQRKLGTLLPQIDPMAEYAWCGSFGTSNTSAPTIGSVPRMPNCYAAMGYGGNGITFSMIAGQMLAGLITGRGDADADLFSFAARARFSG